jgi:hypothetical protein
MQKMRQQKQLAIKRQRDLTKTSFGVGVVPQLDTALAEVTPKRSAALGWNKSVEQGGGCGKLPLNDPSSLMRVLVPSIEQNSSPKSLFTSPPERIGEILVDTCLLGTEDGSEPSRALATEVAVKNGWDLKIEAPAPKALRRRKLWRPWGTSNRTSTESQESETIVEDFQAVNDEGAPVALGTADGWQTFYYCGRKLGLAAIPESDGQCGPANGPQCASCRRFMTRRAPQELRVSFPPADADDVHDQCSVESIGRAATPWQPSDDVLECSFNSDLSFSSFGILDDGADEEDEDLKSTPASPIVNDHEHVDPDMEDSIDSGIEQTVSNWKREEKQSPDQKRSRFTRFIPNVQAPRLWRTPKMTSLHRTPVVQIEGGLDD